MDFPENLRLLRQTVLYAGSSNIQVNTVHYVICQSTWSFVNTTVRT